ncbi:MAG TPA: TadE/TadG family type IV pilus assembly protein [Anaerolineales bacterium]|jgi:Flp pilus assembly protein TadG
MMTRSSQKGSAMIEFMMVGIPLIFVLISIFEISRGMWIYVTLAHAVREATRYALVHGNTCTETPNTCAVTVSQIAGRIENAGVGLLPAQLTVTMASGNRTIGPASLQSLLANTTYFPTGCQCTTRDPGGEPGEPVTITATYPFQSAITMFWPGVPPQPIPAGGLPAINLPASSRGRIEF